MKKSLFVSAMLLLTINTSFAGEFKIIDLSAPNLKISDELDTSFSINLSNGEGSVKLTASRKTVHRGPRGSRNVYYKTMLKHKQRVEGLQLEGDKAIFLTPEGEMIECGTMGESRVFKIPTLYLSGNCDLKARLVTIEGSQRLIVNLITK